MKLYYTPGASSLAPRIIAFEAGLEIEYDKVDLKTKTTASGRDFIRINPKGHVPALALQSGEVLAEVPVILEYLADQAPSAQLLPTLGSWERYRRFCRCLPTRSSFRFAITSPASDSSWLISAAPERCSVPSCRCGWTARTADPARE